MCNFVSFSNKGVVLTRKTMTAEEIDIYSGSVAGSGEGTPPLIRPFNIFTIFLKSKFCWQQDLYNCSIGGVLNSLILKYINSWHVKALK